MSAKASKIQIGDLLKFNHPKPRNITNIHFVTKLGYLWHRDEKDDDRISILYINLTSVFRE